MGLKDQLNEDMKKAMKDKDRPKLSVIRMLRSEIQNQEINKGEELTEEELSELIFKEVKKRKDSLKDYQASNRDDLIKELEKEIEILEEYQPEMLTEDEIKDLIRDAIKKTGASSKKEIGNVMKEVMPRVKGKADGKLVNKLVSEELQ